MKDNLHYLLLVAVIIFTVFLFFRSDEVSNQEMIYADKFIGQVQAFSSTSFSVLGNYVSEGHPELLNIEERKEREVFLNEETKIQRTTKQRPSKEELLEIMSQNNGLYRIEDFPGEEETVTVSEFLVDLERHEGLSVTIESKVNIFDQKSFTASTINYLVQNIPLSSGN